MPSSSLTDSGGSRNPFNLVNVTGASSMTMISEPMSHLLTLPFLEREYLNTQHNLDRTRQTWLQDQARLNLVHFLF